MVSDHSFDAPLDHSELCARVRFRYDEPQELPPGELGDRERLAVQRMALLQAGGVRVTRTLTPGLHAKLSEISGRLLLQEPPALYIHADAEVNASALYGGRRCVLSATSALVNLLTVDEFGAIMGHELAHLGLRHVPRQIEGDFAEVFHLARSRAAEVSCDRVSVIAAGDPLIAVSALLKVVSGLDAAHIALDIDAVLGQLADRMDDADLQWEALQSHPVLPFRVWAMHRFSQSDLCRSLLGLSGGEPFDRIEDEISERFHAVGEGLVGRTVTDHMHEALSWIGAMLVCADGRQPEAEVAELSAVAGAVWTEHVLAYMRVHGMRAVENRAKESLGTLAEAGVFVQDRVRQHIEALLVQVGTDESRATVDALLQAAWDD